MNKITYQQVVENFDENCWNPDCPVDFVGRVFIYGFEADVSPALIRLVKLWAAAEPGIEAETWAKLVDVELGKSMS